jgi:membrane protein implicated in regulation of membrane protease activity
MLVILALALALIFLPFPANLAVIGLAGLCELGMMLLGFRYTNHFKPKVGAETLIGKTARAITPLAPHGQVKLNGEIWQGRAESTIQAGACVRVKAIHGLTLEVEEAAGGSP